MELNNTNNVILTYSYDGKHKAHNNCHPIVPYQWPPLDVITFRCLTKLFCTCFYSCVNYSGWFFLFLFFFVFVLCCFVFFFFWIRQTDVIRWAVDDIIIKCFDSPSQGSGCFESVVDTLIIGCLQDWPAGTCVHLCVCVLHLTYYDEIREERMGR
jgi:hypothetical protein